jgi:hypothetical protein
MLARFYEQGEVEIFEESEQLTAFRRELLGIYPALEDLPENQMDAPGISPWAMTPLASDRLIELNLVFSGPDDAPETIVALARKYELALYDPQGPTIHPPSARPRGRGCLGSAALVAAFVLSAVRELKT